MRGARRVRGVAQGGQPDGRGLNGRQRVSGDGWWGCSGDL